MRKKKYEKAQTPESPERPWSGGFSQRTIFNSKKDENPVLITALSVPLDDYAAMREPGRDLYNAYTMIMSAVKRIPVTEHWWKELSEMRLAGQTYAELREDLIADRKKPGGGSRESLEIPEKKRDMYRFHILGIDLCVHPLARLADEVNNLPDKIRRIVRPALVRLKENPFPFRSDKKNLVLRGDYPGRGISLDDPCISRGLRGDMGSGIAIRHRRLGAVSPRMRQ